MVDDAPTWAHRAASIPKPGGHAAPDPFVADEVLCRSLIVVDDQGRPRIRLSVAGDGEAEVIVSDEAGCFVSMTAGAETTLGMRVDDGHQATDITTRGLANWVMQDGTTKERIDEMEARTAHLEELLERFAEGRDDRGET